MNKINIKDILVPEGRRPLDLVKVAEIAASIKAVGLLSPIGVAEVPADGIDCVAFTLVWGQHRLEACRSLCWETITVIEVDKNWPDEDDDDNLDDINIKMMEIAENLHRAELTTQRRNEHLAEWVALLEKRGVPNSDAEQPNSKPGPKPSPAVAAVAKASGLTKKTIKEAIKSTKVSPAVKAASAAAGLSSKQRLAVARHAGEDEQLRAVSKQAATKPKKKVPELPRSPTAIDPVLSCLGRVHALVFEWLPEIPDDQWPRLMSELRLEIDHIEQTMEKRSEARSSVLR